MIRVKLLDGSERDFEAQMFQIAADGSLILNAAHQHSLTNQIETSFVHCLRRDQWLEFWPLEPDDAGSITQPILLETRT